VPTLRNPPATANRPFCLIAEQLLNAGADPNRGKEGITPLMAACYCGHLEMAKLLVARGAEVGREGKTLDRLREKVTAVSIAANGKYSELANWLMDNGAPVAKLQTGHAGGRRPSRRCVGD